MFGRIVVFVWAFVLTLGPLSLSDYGAPAARAAEARFGFTDIRLPANLHIFPPGPEVPADAARFVGVWAGSWDYILNHVLVVEELRLTPDGGVEAIVIYAVGVAPQWEIRAPSWVRLRGTIKDGQLVLITKAAVFVYHFRDGELRATRDSGGLMVRARMRQQKQ
jgi:hypothetical protein